MQLSNSQKNAVNQLIEKYHAWKFKQKEKTVDFSAPTGSGKTFIISNFVAELLRNKNPAEKIVVFLATLSSSKLPKQFAEKVKSKYMDHLSWKFDVEYKMAPSSKTTSAKDYEPRLIAANNTMIIVGRSSFTKSSIFIQRGCFEKFLAQIKNENYQLVYIRDEAHHGGKKENKKLDNFETKIQTAADFVIRMTATAKNPQNVVAITEEDLFEDQIQLLKNKPIVNYAIDRLKNKSSKLELLDHCLKVFKQEVIPAYQKACQTINKTIHPAFLIQVDSEHKENSKEFKDLIKDVKKRIQNLNLNYAIYFDRIKTSNLRENVNLLEISENQSPIDVILFKIGPATGWDIPRACMLLQLRNVSSWTLMQQTSGRIKRNPVPEVIDLPVNSIFNSYYLYLNRQQGLQREFFNYELKKPAQKWTWIQGEITNANEVKIAKTEEYRTKMKVFLNNAIENETINRCVEAIIQQDNHIIEFEEYTNGKKIYSNKNVIKNALELFIQYNKKCFRYQKLIQPIEELLANTAKKIGKNYYYLIIYVCENIAEIKAIYDKCFFNQKIVYQYQLNDQAQAMPNYTLIQSKDQPKPFFPIDELKSNYLYQVNLIDNQSKQLLDSKPEKIFMGYIDHFIDLKPTIKKMVAWAKNPNRGQINLEYIDENQTHTHALFPDFVFKIGKYYLYVEIKSINDFSSAKTNQIKTVFEKYITKNPNANIVLSVCYIDVDRSYNPIAKTMNYSRFSEIKFKLPFEKTLERAVERHQKDLETC